MPYIIGIAGSVAAGKSTTARVLRALLSRWPNTPKVDLVTTDGFLYPNAVLQREGLMEKKGFPESYDGRALLRFLAHEGRQAQGRAPVYSHLVYDVVPGGDRDRRPARHPHRRGPQRAAAGPRPGRHGRCPSCPTSSISRSISTPTRTCSRSGTSSRFMRCGRPPSAIPGRFSSKYAELTDEEAEAVARGHLAAHQPAQPAGQHPADAAPRDLVLTRARATASRRWRSASSDGRKVLRRRRLFHVNQAAQRRPCFAGEVEQRRLRPGADMLDDLGGREPAQPGAGHSVEVRAPGRTGSRPRTGRRPRSCRPAYRSGGPSTACVSSRVTTRQPSSERVTTPSRSSSRSAETARGEIGGLVEAPQLVLIGEQDVDGCRSASGRGTRRGSGRRRSCRRASGRPCGRPHGRAARRGGRPAWRPADPTDSPRDR